MGHPQTLIAPSKKFESANSKLFRITWHGPNLTSSHLCLKIAQNKIKHIWHILCFVLFCKCHYDLGNDRSNWVTKRIIGG